MDVLVIEGHDGRLAWMADVLRGEGHRVLVAADGDEGLWLFRTYGARVVVADLLTPAPDGLHAIAAIKLEAPAARVLDVCGGPTGVGMRWAANLARALGAEVVLTGAFGADVFAASVRALLRFAPAA